MPDAYVHRIGRTARAGRDGIAIAFCAPDETRLLHDIEKLMKIDIPVASGERPAGLASPTRPNNNRGGRNNNGGQQRGPREGGRHNGESRPSRHHAPRDADNDLEVTSDFKRVKTAEGDAGRPAGPRKQRRPARKPGGSGANRHACRRQRPGKARFRQRQSRPQPLRDVNR